jgi:hypothetical protein
VTVNIVSRVSFRRSAVPSLKVFDAVRFDSQAAVPLPLDAPDFEPGDRLDVAEPCVACGMLGRHPVLPDICDTCEGKGLVYETMETLGYRIAVVDDDESHQMAELLGWSHVVVAGGRAALHRCQTDDDGVDEWSEVELPNRDAWVGIHYGLILTEIG